MHLGKDIISGKIELLVKSFERVLYEDDEIFLENMKTKQLAGDDVGRYRHWEWTQGVGLYGIWKLYERTGREDYLAILKRYYRDQLAGGLPSKNVNTVAPMLALSFLAERLKDSLYMETCREWAEWIMTGLPRTREGGFQHITSDSQNDQELWDDTLFMTVLFLARMGILLGRDDYVEEATYQFLLHVKYLSDRETGLWFHGWTFSGNNNFAGALWGRGNCWITIAIPALIEMVSPRPAIRRFLTEALSRQIMSLETFQNPEGMWHTLIDDPSSYPESSATCGFAYGILLSVRAGLVDPRYAECARRALPPILERIDEEGLVSQVSYGTAMGRDSKDFYKAIPLMPMPYGQAIAILFLMEALEETGAARR